MKETLYFAMSKMGTVSGLYTLNEWERMGLHEGWTYYRIEPKDVVKVKMELIVRL